MPEDLHILRCRHVMDKCGLPESSLYQLIADGKFPKPIALSEHRVGWLNSEVEDWLRKRIAASREVVRPRLRRRHEQTRPRIRPRSEGAAR